jgi:DNA-binding response OmpR family regulator
MENIVALYPNWHILFLEDDWVIRQILIEHFRLDDRCHVVSFTQADKALSYLQADCGAEHIFSNIRLSGREGIELSSGPGRRNQIVLAIAPGYNAEDDRFQAIEDGLGLFRVKRYHYLELRQFVRLRAYRSSTR